MCCEEGAHHDKVGLVRVLAEGEERLRHWLNVPDATMLLVEVVLPFTAKLLRERPAMLRTAEAHADQVALLHGSNSVLEVLTAVEDGEVVYEVDITGLSRDLQLGSLCNGLNSIESLNLAGRDSGEARRARVDAVAEKWCPTKVHDNLRAFVEDDGATLEVRAARMTPTC